MKIAFIYPATQFDLEYHAAALPIGLLYLTAVAEARGMDVDIFDIRHGKQLPDSSQLNSYDVIGFTAMSMQVTHALDLAGQLRANGFQGNIIFGGPHASVAADHLKQQKIIDAIFVGEAEETFMQYLAYLQGKPHELQRIWLRQKDGQWLWYPGDSFIQIWMPSHCRLAKNMPI